MPSFSTENERKQIGKAQTFFSEKIVGRTEIIKEICDSWFTWRQNPRTKGDHRPALTYFFSGPAGTGKSTFAEVIAEVHNQVFKLYGDTLKTEMKTIYLPMANLDSSKSTTLFSQIYKFILENPSGIIVLEEIEKIEKKYLEQFLEFLGTGIIKYSGEEIERSEGVREFQNGRSQRIIDRRNIIVIMTSNLGSEELKNVSYEKGKEELEKLVKENLGEPFFGRITNIFPFIPLSEKEFASFIETFIFQQQQNFAKSFELEFEDSFYQHYQDRAKALNGDLRKLGDEIRNELTNALQPLIEEKMLKRKIGYRNGVIVKDR